MAKLRRGEPELRYKAGTEEKSREEMLLMVKGKSISEGKAIVSSYEKELVTPWFNKRGEVECYSIYPGVYAIEVTRGDPEKERQQLLDEMRSALEKIESGEATAKDIAEALRLQLKYAELLEDEI